MLRVIRGRRPSRLAAALLLVLVAPFVVVATPSAAPVAVASGIVVGDATVGGATTYTIDPLGRRVAARVVLSVRNTKPDLVGAGGTTRYYYRSWSIAVQDEARRVRATRDGVAAPVTIRQRAGYKLVEVAIVPAVYEGQTATLLIDFDLPDGGARSDSRVRVGAAFATFVAYAYGDDRATVQVVIPPGYDVTTQGDPVRSGSDASGTVLSTGNVDDEAWYAVVTADRPAALALQTLRLPIDGQERVVQVRAWPEDGTWAATVGDELTRGLPALGGLIGLAWPVSGPLEVTESYTPLLGGYAGFYTQAADGGPSRIRVTEEPDPFVILHEAGHAWFNSALLDGRWINEGLADQYASLAQVAIGGPPTAPDPVDRSASVAFPLDAWPPPGRIDDTATDEREQYGYAASWTVVRSIYAEIGAARMQGVLAAAAARRMAYVGRPEAETWAETGTATGWRYFLDLLEQRGRSQGAATLLRTWVVVEGDRAVLDVHEGARAAYAALVERGAGWLPGLAVRLPMARWEFPAAGQQVDKAGQVLALRADIGAQETTLGLADGGVLRGLYEGAATTYDACLALATDELTTLSRLRDAGAAVDAERGPLEVIGLWGADPAADLAAAEGAYRTGQLGTARSDAALAAGLIAAAADSGAQRVALGSGGGALVVFVAFGIRAGRRRRGPSRLAGAGAPATLGALTNAEVPTIAEAPTPGEPAAPGEGDERA